MNPPEMRPWNLALRLGLEVAGHPVLGAAGAALTVLHDAVSAPRVRWLLTR